MNKYLYIKNHISGEVTQRDEPLSLKSVLFNIMRFYRVEKAEPGGQLIMAVKIGKSESDNITINFYKEGDSQIIIETGGDYYRPVRGKFLYEDLEYYLNN